MSDYTIAVAWSGKDNLADSDANKVISGADFNTEFSAVRTAVNTKADINGDASEAFSALNRNRWNKYYTSSYNSFCRYCKQCSST